MIEDFVDLIPEHLMDVSGAVFDSGRRAFESPSNMFLALILGAVQKIRALTQYRGILRKCLIVSRKIGQHTETNTGAERGQVPDLCNEGCFTYLRGWTETLVTFLRVILYFHAQEI